MSPAGGASPAPTSLGEGERVTLRFVPQYRRWIEAVLGASTSLAVVVILTGILLFLRGRLALAPSPLLAYVLPYVPVAVVVGWVLLGYRRGRILEVDDYGISLQTGRRRTRVLPWTDVTEIRHGLRPYRTEKDRPLRMGYVLVARGRRWRDTLRVGTGHRAATADEPLGALAALVERKARRHGIPLVDVGA